MPAHDCIHRIQREGLYAEKDIWQRYLRKFSKQGQLLEADLGLFWKNLPTMLSHQRLEFRQLSWSRLGGGGPLEQSGGGDGGRSNHDYMIRL